MPNIQTMQNGRPEARAEAKSEKQTGGKMRLKSRFNDAEYERWSEYLHSGKNGKSKGSGQK
jgi:hypothetical protein